MGNVQQEKLGGDPSLDLYVSYRQESEANQYLLVRTQMPLSNFQKKAEQLLWSIDPQQSIFDFQTYDHRVLAGVWQLRMARTVLTSFGFVALVIASLGIYGVMSYTVRRKTREMGVRLALGSSPGAVMRLVLLRSGTLTAAGLLLGSIAAFLFSQILRKSISHVPAMNASGFLASTAILMGVALAAAALPAQRASIVDPALALREE